MASTLELFPAESVAMDSPRLAWQKRVTTELAIFTDYCEISSWMAFSQAKALEALAGYSLTAAQKADPVELFAGYCRLLDDAGMVADCKATEFEAIEFVAMRHGLKLWNEETPFL